MSRTLGSTAPDSRTRILDAARALFAERGYAGTSMRDIAEALGFTKAALYYHFPGKADLLYALVEPALAELDAMAVRAEGGYDREALLRDFVGLLAARAPGMIALFGDPSAKHDLSEKLSGAEQRSQRLEEALAPDGDVLSVRCALGAARGGVFATLAARARAGEPPELSAAEVERVIRASLAAWEAAA